jgi:hypothetical protein
MWTPLILICYVDRMDCAVPAAPAYLSEDQCLLALEYALEVFVLPQDMAVMSYACYNWGLGL